MVKGHNMGKIAKREDIRDLILDAVDGLLAMYGYGKMTMQDVARQVGMNENAVYAAKHRVMSRLRQAFAEMEQIW